MFRVGKGLLTRNGAHAGSRRVQRVEFQQQHVKPTGALKAYWGYIRVILGGILGLYLGVISWGYILGLSWGYLGVILGLYWGYIGVILGLYWGYIRVILGLH